MVKWKVALFFLVVLLTAFILPVGVDMLVGYTAVVSNEGLVSKHEDIGFYCDDVYIGTSVVGDDGVQSNRFDIFDCTGISGESEVIVTPSAAFSDGIVDFSRNVESIFIDGKNAIIVEGLNVTSASDILYYVSDYGYLNGNVVLQKDISLGEISSSLFFNEGKDDVAFKSEYGIYGNGHTITGPESNRSYFNALFTFSGTNEIEIRDTRFIGRDFETGADIVLDDLCDAGIMVEFSKCTDVNVENCIFQNANRHVGIKSSDVRFGNCIFVNAADTGISLKTVKGKKSTVSVEDCIFYNLVVSGITNWCSDAVTSESYCTINLLGKVSFYTWKKDDTAQIMPGYSDYSSLANSYFQSVMKKNDMKKYLVAYGEHNYFSSAIMVLCSAGGDSRNVAEINGAAEQGITKITAPINAIVASFLTTSDLYGYTDTSVIRPDETPDFAF